MTCTDNEVCDNQAYLRSAFHRPALKVNNIMRLLDFACFRTKCVQTLRTLIALHCRDCSDLVSKYLLTLKTYPRVGCVSGEHRH